MPLGLVDRPDSRKQHVGEIPAVGGLAIYLSVFLGFFLVGSSSTVHMSLLVSGMLVLIGLLDDKYGLSPLLRLLIQSLAAVSMMYLGGIGIESIGSILGGKAVEFSGLATAGFTILCTVGVINSINMIDGVDGLSGAVILMTFAPLVYLCWVAGESELLILLVSFMGAILAFLYFNARVFRPVAKVFMGDTGSMLLGFMLVWTLITLTQGPGAVLTPVAAGWIFGLPLVDTVAVMAGRLLKKRSPFDADRSHFHYKLIDSGLSVNHSVAVIACLHLLFIVTGLLGNAASLNESVLFWAFVIVVVLHFFLTDSAIRALIRGSARVSA